MNKNRMAVRGPAKPRAFFGPSFIAFSSNQKEKEPQTFGGLKTFCLQPISWPYRVVEVDMTGEIMEIAVYFVLVLAVSGAFEARFKKTFLPSLIFGTFLTPIFTLSLLIVANSARNGLKDRWSRIEYFVTPFTADLPTFSKPKIEIETRETLSLRQMLVEEEKWVQDSIDTYSREKHMRKLKENDKRAFNRELFDFAQKKEWQLNSFIERKILSVLQTGILAETIDQDDFIDLAKNKVDPLAKEFSSPDSMSYQAPDPLELRDEPSLVNTPLPKFLRILPKFFKAPIHASLLKRNRDVWESERDQLDERRQIQANDYSQAEASRRERLKIQKEAFDEALQTYEKEARAHNAELEMRLQGFEAGEKSSVESYALMVLKRSNYPTEVAPQFRVNFHEDTSELEIFLTLKDSKRLADIAVKYKLVKSRGALEESPVTKTEFKKLYSQSIMQLLIRAAHEISEADRSGTIKSLSVQGLLADMMSGAEVPIALLAGTPDEFAASKLKGEVSALFKSLGGVISSDPIAASPVSNKGSIRGK